MLLRVSKSQMCYHVFCSYVIIPNLFSFGAVAACPLHLLLQFQIPKGISDDCPNHYSVLMAKIIYRIQCRSAVRLAILATIWHVFQAFLQTNRLKITNRSIGQLCKAVAQQNVTKT